MEFENLPEVKHSKQKSQDVNAKLSSPRSNPSITQMSEGRCLPKLLFLKDQIHLPSADLHCEGKAL